MTEDAFARRSMRTGRARRAGDPPFVSTSPRTGSPSRNYSLAPEAFHCRDRVHRRRAGRAADRADAAGRRVRVRRAAAAGAAADHLGAAFARWAPTPGRRSGSGSRRPPAAARFRPGLAKIDTAIYRRKRIEFEYHTMETDPTGSRQVDPYHLLFEGGQFYLVGYSTSARTCGSSGSRGSAARSPTRPRPSTTSSARRTSTRAASRTASRGSSATPSGRGRGRDPRGPRLVRRAPVRRLRDLRGPDLPHRLRDPRLLISWALEYGLRIVGPPRWSRRRAARRPPDRVPSRRPPRRRPERVPPSPPPAESNGRGRGETAIRPERFARLVTLATVLIAAGRMR